MSLAMSGFATTSCAPSVLWTGGDSGLPECVDVLYVDSIDEFWWTGARSAVRRLKKPPATPARAAQNRESVNIHDESCRTLCFNFA